MKTEKRIRQIAAKKTKVIITAKVRNQDGFIVTGPSVGIGGQVSRQHRTKKEALEALLARVRCWEDTVWKIEPVKHTPNPALKADVPWKRKVL